MPFTIPHNEKCLTGENSITTELLDIVPRAIFTHRQAQNSASCSKIHYIILYSFDTKLDQQAVQKIPEIVVWRRINAHAM
jgi:hypothetical protein